MNKFLKNSLGMSMFEMVAGLAIFGGISVVAMKNLDMSQQTMKNNQQRLDIEASEKSISDILKKKALCEAVLGNLNVDALKSGISLENDNRMDQGTEPKQQEPRNCVEPKEIPSEYYSPEEFKKVYEEYQKKCFGDQPQGEGSKKKPGKNRKQGIEGGAIGGLLPDDPDQPGTSGDDKKDDPFCVKPPSQRRFTPQEYRRMQQEFEQKMAAFIQCTKENEGLSNDGEVKTKTTEEMRENKAFNTAAGIVDLSRAQVQLEDEMVSGLKIVKIDIKLGDMAGTEGQVPIKFTLTFAVSGKGNDTDEQTMKTIEREVEMMVQIINNQIVCDNLQGSTILDTASEKICAQLGGTIQAGVCDLGYNAATDPDGNLDPQLRARILKAICEGLDEDGDGNALGNICSTIDVSGTINARNISPNHFVINNQKRSQNDNTKCGGGSYLTGFSSGAPTPGNNIPAGAAGPGAKSCGTYSNGFTAAAIPSCDNQDGYFLTGTNSGAGTSTCTNRDYSYNATLGRCDYSNGSSENAALCKIFDAGTCSGSTAGTIVNAPNGDPCGSGKTCSAGDCIDAPTCDNEYRITGTNDATGTSRCSVDEKTVNADFSGCNISSRNTVEAGVCKVIKVGTCTGTADGEVENVADGTPCGGGNTCSAGVCGGDDGGGLCASGGTYTSEGDCLASGLQLVSL